MEKVAFDTFVVQVPSGWDDITDTLEADNAPYTLAHNEGVGALQFTVVLYQRGRVPNPTQADLWAMIDEFAEARTLGAPTAVVTEEDPLVLAAASFEWGEDFLRVWQVSDGRNFAFITYTCAAEYAGPEVATCEQIVRSIAFKT